MRALCVRRTCQYQTCNGSYDCYRTSLAMVRFPLSQPSTHRNSSSDATVRQWAKRVIKSILLGKRHSLQRHETHHTQKVYRETQKAHICAQARLNDENAPPETFVNITLFNLLHIHGYRWNVISVPYGTKSSSPIASLEGFQTKW